MKSQLKNILFGCLKVFVAVALIYWLVSSGKLKLESLSLVFSSPLVIVLLLLTVINLLSSNYRWHLLLQSLDIKQSYFQSLKLGLIGMFFNYAMPGGVGGDLVKGYYIVKVNPKKRTASATSILLDRLIGMASMALMAILALFTASDLLFSDWKLQSILVSLSALFFGFVLIVLLSSSSRALAWVYGNSICRKLNFKGLAFKILEACHQIARRPSLVLKTFLLSLFAQTCLILVAYICCVHILGVPLDLSLFFFAIPLGMIVSAAPIAPAGIGVGQAALYSFFEMMGVSDPGLGSTAMTMIQILLFACGLVGGYFYIKMDLKVLLEKQRA